jgi:2-phosphosulfolactate phosphatase
MRKFFSAVPPARRNLAAPMEHFDQHDFAIRFEWGERGLEALAATDVAAFVIVDVLSFSTCVAVAVDRGANILPCRWHDGRAVEYAEQHRALLAGRRSDSSAKYSLSPQSLGAIPSGTSLVLPSPNGSTLSLQAAKSATVVAGCLHNRASVSAFLRRQCGPVAVIAAGERWPDGSLRPCLEDLVGAGAILAALNGKRSPEADAAVASYEAASTHLRETLANSGSGRELSRRGYLSDTEIAAELDAAASVPVLRGTRFVRLEENA